jgi:hypothetical protein
MISQLQKGTVLKFLTPSVSKHLLSVAPSEKDTATDARETRLRDPTDQLPANSGFTSALQCGVYCFRSSSLLFSGLVYSKYLIRPPTFIKCWHADFAQDP